MVGRPTVSRRILFATVILSCVGIAAALITSNLFLLNRSIAIADQMSEELEVKLVTHEIESRVANFIADQEHFLHHNSLLDSDGGAFAPSHASGELVKWMWADLHIQQTIMISSRNKPLLIVRENEELPLTTAHPIINEHKELINKARRRYYSQLARESLSRDLAGEYETEAASARKVAHTQPHELGSAYAWTILPIDDAFTFVIAYVVTPFFQAAEFSHREPVILLSFTPVDRHLMQKMRNELELPDLHFSLDEAENKTHGTVIVSELDDSQFVRVRWTPSKPSRTIWDQTIPILLGTFLLSVCALLLIATRFSSMILALRRSEEYNRFLALHDALTGLPNRAHFDRALELVLKPAERKRCALVCLDLDRFKAVNDTFGHQAGDHVLKEVADRITRLVGEDGVAARVGGDEFFILLREYADRDTVLALSKQLIADISRPIRHGNDVLQIGASIGVAYWPDDAATAKSIIRAADDALYRAKERGRGTVSTASRQRRKSDREAAGQPIIEPRRGFRRAG